MLRGKQYSVHKKTKMLLVSPCRINNIVMCFKQKLNLHVTQSVLAHHTLYCLVWVLLIRFVRREPELLDIDGIILDIQVR